MSKPFRDPDIPTVLAASSQDRGWPSWLPAGYRPNRRIRFGAAARHPLTLLTLFAHKPPAGDLALWLATYVERSEAIFFAILGWFEGHQRKGSGRKLLPDRQFVGCNRKPAEFEHEPARLRYLADLGPSNLSNRQSFRLQLLRREGLTAWQTSTRIAACKLLLGFACLAVRYGSGALWRRCVGCISDRCFWFENLHRSPPRW
jgi:hypothetical protein